MSKKKFLIDTLGYTKEEAEAELLEIQKESVMSIDRFDIVDTSAQEGLGVDPNEEPEAKEEQAEAAEDEDI